MLDIIPKAGEFSLSLEYWHYKSMANDLSADSLMLNPVYPLGFEKVNLIKH